jgi:hypothetical protein
MSGAGAPPGRGSGSGGGGGDSRSFDFGGDDVLCSYDDFAPASSEPKRSDPVDRVIARSVPLFLKRLCCVCVYRSVSSACEAFHGRVGIDLVG